MINKYRVIFASLFLIGYANAKDLELRYQYANSIYYCTSTIIFIKDDRLFKNDNSYFNNKYTNENTFEELSIIELYVNKSLNNNIYDLMLIASSDTMISTETITVNDYGNIFHLQQEFSDKLQDSNFQHENTNINNIHSKNSFTNFKTLFIPIPKDGYGKEWYTENELHLGNPIGTIKLNTNYNVQINKDDYAIINGNAEQSSILYNDNKIIKTKDKKYDIIINEDILWDKIINLPSSIIRNSTISFTKLNWREIESYNTLININQEIKLNDYINTVE